MITYICISKVCTVEGRLSTRKSYGANKPTDDEVEVAMETEKSIKSKE